jgi:rRNA-processing protein FCF1
MIQVILDTNFLLIPAQFSVDIFSEIDRVVEQKYELCVLDKSLEELDRVAKGAESGRDKRAAMLGIAFVAAKKPRLLPAGEKYVDEAILCMAEKGKHIVATQDMELKRKLKEKGVSVITMRKQDHLMRVDA